MSNIFSMLPEIPMMKQEETSSWIAAAVTTWQKIGACSRTLITLSKSKFDWETILWWRQKRCLIPNLKENLLNFGQMMEKAYALHFKEDICTIYGNYNKR
ncbi:hypothetical protein CR513_25044, partial [Mucuna pruriens]